MLVGRYASAETVVVEMLKDMLARRIDYAGKDGERFFDAAQNARVVANKAAISTSKPVAASFMPAAPGCAGLKRESAVRA